MSDTDPRDPPRIAGVAGLRLDLVVNQLVAGALTTGVVAVLSDGTPGRPLIDVDDMALAIDWALQEQGSLTGDLRWSEGVLRTGPRADGAST
jgi:nucleoside-diphosphate-sugar epimerase